MQTLAIVGVRHPRLEDAYATVRREDYLGPGPWPIFTFPTGSYIPTPSADPVYLYCNALFGIVPERRLNNGEPSSHAMWIAAAAPVPGDHVVHVGAGVGYYSAILGYLAGPSGRVTAIEFDEALAARAAANFAGQPNVAVLTGDGARVPFDAADVIYVNAGATHPVDHWLDRLRDGGRLMIPLTTDANFTNPGSLRALGAYFLITRRGDDFDARWISYVGVFPCEGARDPESAAALSEAFKTPRWNEVTRLYRTGDLPAEQCWLRAPGWSLAYH